VKRKTFLCSIEAGEIFCPSDTYIAANELNPSGNYKTEAHHQLWKPVAHLADLQRPLWVESSHLAAVQNPAPQRYSKKHRISGLYANQQKYRAGGPGDRPRDGILGLGNG